MTNLQEVVNPQMRAVGEVSTNIMSLNVMNTMGGKNIQSTQSQRRTQRNDQFTRSRELVGEVWENCGQIQELSDIALCASQNQIS